MNAINNLCDEIAINIVHISDEVVFIPIEMPSNNE